MMGTTHGDFLKYPRTPHLFGSTGTDDEQHLGETEPRLASISRTSGSSFCNAAATSGENRQFSVGAASQ